MLVLVLVLVLVLILILILVLILNLCLILLLSFPSSRSIASRGEDSGDCSASERSIRAGATWTCLRWLCIAGGGTFLVYAWQVNGPTGAYMYHGKQRVPGLPTCHSGSRRRGTLEVT